MIKEIFPELYQVTIPMPNNPLKALNSYILKSQKRNLIIDTCFDLPECFKATCAGLKKLDIDLDKTDFFITHMHEDHSGLVRRLASSNSSIFCSEQDGQAINTKQSEMIPVMRNFFLKAGFPPDRVEYSLQKFSNITSDRAIMKDLEFKVVSDGDTIGIGDYNFTCVVASGHTPGHVCLYEENKKIFISGDHILNNITPNISLFYIDNVDPLADYLRSLDKVHRLDIEAVLPGHRSIFNNCRERISEIVDHHRIRNNEILDILEQGTQNVYEISSQMTWNITFETFPHMQKWFAVGEAFAHLKYLENQKNVKKEIRDNMIFYSLSER